MVDVGDAVWCVVFFDAGIGEGRSREGLKDAEENARIDRMKRRTVGCKLHR